MTKVMKFFLNMILRILSLSVIPVVLGIVCWAILKALEIASEFLSDKLEMAWEFISNNVGTMIVIIVVVALAQHIFDSIRNSLRKKDEDE